MAWSAPPNFVNGAVLTEGQLDTLSDDLTWLHDLANLITGSTAADTGDSTKLHILRAAAATVAYDAGVTGDTVMRFRVAADGTMEWGAGGATATDTNLYRTLANRLQTDDDFRAVGVVIAKYKASGGVTDADLLSGTTNANGALVIQGSPPRIYARVAGVWKSAPLT